MKNLYAILGVEETATAAQIKKIYRGLAKKYHPDANPDNPEAEKRFKEITEAYEILGDESKREKYDRERRLSKESAQKTKERPFGPKREQSQQTRKTSQGTRTSSHHMDFGKQFENFFGFDPSSSKVHTTKKDENPLNTDELFKRFFTPNQKR